MATEPAAAFLAEAHRLASLLLDQAGTRADGSLFWPRPGPAEPGETGQPATLGPHLYAGHAGIALFFAALGKSSGDPRFGDAALRILAPLRRQLGKLLTQLAARPDSLKVELGAVTGLASFIYVFLRVGAWLQQPELIHEAGAIGGLITRERIAASGSADLISGAAGVLLVLLLLEDEAPPATRENQRPLELAIACGERLLALHQGGDGEGGEGGGWPNFVQPPSSGLAHGASGIVLALARLARRTGRPDFRAAAAQGLAFERGHYDPEVANWWPVRGHKTRLMLNAWCNGAAGIALARLGLLRAELLPEAAAKTAAELETALASVAGAPEALLDSLCCGSFGRAEILGEAARRLGRQDLAAAAERLAAAALAAARERAGRYLTNSPGGSAPGFFTGLAGIGYALLRLAGHQDLPCVLALE